MEMFNFDESFIAETIDESLARNRADQADRVERIRRMNKQQLKEFFKSGRVPQWSEINQ